MGTHFVGSMGRLHSHTYMNSWFVYAKLVGKVTVVYIYIYMYILHGSLWEWVILQLNDLNPSFSLIYFGKSSKLYGHLDSFGGFPHFFRDTPTFCMHPGPTCGFHQWSDVTKTEPENWGFNRCSWKKSYTRWNISWNLSKNMQKWGNSRMSTGFFIFFINNSTAPRFGDFGGGIS